MTETILIALGELTLKELRAIHRGGGRIALAEGCRAAVERAAAFKSLKPKGTPASIGSRSVLPVETGRWIIHAFRDAIEDKDFPDLRESEIMAISGHLTPAMLARYTHLRADRLGARLPGGKLKSPSA